MLVKLDRAGVAGRHVAVGVLGGDGERLGRPGRAVEGRPVRTNWLAAAGLTAIPETVPATAAVAVSVAVTDWLPAVLSVTVKVCDPASAAVKV